MMKQTVCLLFVLALVAQICAIPDDNVDAEAKAKAAAEKASAEGKDKADAVTKHTAKDASDAKGKAEGAPADAKEHAEKLAKGDHKDHAKDCHKSGAGKFPKIMGDHPASKALKGVEEVGKRAADAGVKVATDFMRIFGL